MDPNTSDRAGDIFISDGFFATVDQSADAGGWYPSTRYGLENPLWRSGHDAPAWDAHQLFEVVEAGETMEVAMLYIVPDEALTSPDFAFVYHDWDGVEDAKAFRIGPLR